MEIVHTLWQEKKKSSFEFFWSQKLRKFAGEGGEKPQSEVVSLSRRKRSENSTNITF